MWTTILLKLGSLLFAVLPVERILAVLINKIIDKLDTTNVSKAKKTLNHLYELVALFDDILVDKMVTVEEINSVQKKSASLRLLLLKLWAAGDSAKSVQTSIAEAGVDASYVEPLLKMNGFIHARLVMVMCMTFAVVSLFMGCLTRTRCQQFDMRDCTVTINEPQSIESGGMPRSIQIGVQDQMVDGGTDSIASGNDTKPALTIPMGDSSFGVIGQLLSGLFRGGTSSTDVTATTTATTAPCTGSTCSDPAP